ncbi:MAG: hypothetical protein KAX49_03805 [Halanaerobiales bacterium]|nr:hypothetical protein [Halanaerobiales bacterium]
MQSEQMNSYEIIKQSLNENLEDNEIINKLLYVYPNSDADSLIILIDNTRRIIKKESYNNLSSDNDGKKHFLVKEKNGYIDLLDGITYREFVEKPYSACKHGFCEKYGALVLKNIIKSKNKPNVFIMIDKEYEQHKPIKIKYHDDKKKIKVWEFSSFEINELIIGMEEGLSNKQLAIRVCCPRECVNKLIKILDINDSVNGKNRKGRVKREGTNKRRENRKKNDRT